MRKQIIIRSNSILDLLAELAKREKDAGIFPEAEVDLFMKVILQFQNMMYVEVPIIICWLLIVLTRSRIFFYFRLLQWKEFKAIS